MDRDGVPVGPLRIVEHGGAITAIEFSPVPRLPTAARAASATTTTRCWSRRCGSCAAYFARDLKEFDLPLAPGGSAFQQRVWEQLLGVAWGETASYGEIAHRLGMTNAAPARWAWPTAATRSRS